MITGGIRATITAEAATMKATVVTMETADMTDDSRDTTRVINPIEKPGTVERSVAACMGASRHAGTRRQPVRCLDEESKSRCLLPYRMVT